MKKQTKLQILKGLVNDSLLERVKLCRYGVQAYNIVKGEEYAVIAAFAKQGGRYYFIDREGRRFLASHYDRAEWLAGEVLEVLADDKAAVSETVDQLERSGSVLVCADFLALFFEECDRRNLTVKSTAAGVDELERMLTRYDLVKQSDESNNDTQSDDSEAAGNNYDDNNIVAIAVADADNSEAAGNNYDDNNVVAIAVADADNSEAAGNNYDDNNVVAIAVADADNSEAAGNYYDYNIDNKNIASIIAPAKNHQNF